MTQQLQTLIETAWDNRAELSPASAPKEVLDAVTHVIDQLNTGKLRVPPAKAWASGPPTSGSRRPCCCRSA